MALSLICSKEKQAGPINSVVDQAVLPKIAYSGMPLDAHHASIDFDLDCRRDMDVQILRVIMVHLHKMTICQTSSRRAFPK